MKKIILKAAFNSLSFGNVSYNIARELYKQDYKVSLFPIGDNFDFSSFDKLDPDFKKWLESSANTRLTTMSKDIPSLSIWHLNGSHESIGSRNFLYSFYELDSPTFTEKNICEMHSSVIFSSAHAKNCFENVNCDNVHSVPLGFDEDFFVTGKDYMKDKIHFGIIGKWEKRKNTAKILKAWAKKYGNNPDYHLSCCIINPFFKNEDMNALIAQALDGKVYGNINFLPRLKTNSEVNELMNSIDIDLSGLSGAEGWNLPSFNASCLGKWSMVLNHTSHKDWANSDNSILIEPSGKESAEDGIFFNKNSPFNQGEINSISEDYLITEFEKSESYKGKINTNGEKLKEKFTYKNTLNNILNIINV
jgi:glycosyltransferase involved in cell wall biosynthesis